ncbi:MAG: hypothetical protein ABW321_05660 [Polyangiales bacterium]
MKTPLVTRREGERATQHAPIAGSRDDRGTRLAGERPRGARGVDVIALGLGCATGIGRGGARGMDVIALGFGCVMGIVRVACGAVCEVWT